MRFLSPERGMIMNLERRAIPADKAKNKRKTRKNLPGRPKIVAGATVILESAILVGALGLITACTSTVNDNATTRYNLQVVVADVFTKQPVNGTVSVNGVSGPNQGVFSIEEGKVNTIKPDAAGYIGGYLFGQINGKDTPINDAAGAHSFTITSDQAITTFIIPDTIDTILYGKCNEGTVRNYGKAVINVGIMKYPDGATGIEPTDDMIKKLQDAIARFNLAGNGVISANYIGIISSKLTDGITNYTATRTPGHGEHFDDAGDANLITSSFMITSPDEKLRTVLEELTQAASGLTSDGGDDVFPYLERTAFDNPVWQYNAELVIRLNQILPRGMQISGTMVPSVQMLDIQMQKPQTTADDFRDGMDSINPFRRERLPHTIAIALPEEGRLDTAGRGEKIYKSMRR